MAFLLDTNVFITAKDKYYGMDFCPAFWDWLSAENARGVVFSVDSVMKELLVVNDELADWVRDRKPGFFLAPDGGADKARQRVEHWANGSDYSEKAKNAFPRGADLHLVSQALAGGHTVVTQEEASDSKKQIKIPDACRQFGVAYVDTFAMLRGGCLRFVLAG